MSLYHSQIGIPESVKAQLPQGKLEVRYSFHAQESRFSDRYGYIPEIKIIDTEAAKVIEVETEMGRVEKVVYRTSLDDKLDICIVVLVNKHLVKTTWINRKSDTHKTLDASKYSK